MKTLEQIFAADRPINDIISDLKYYKEKVMDLPEWSELEKEYEPKMHRIITDKTTYPDKQIKDDKGNITRIEPITRIAIGLQKLATKRMSEFLFTIPVKNVAEDTEDQTAKDQVKAISKILKKNKWNSSNKKRAKIISSECECATLWYVVPSDNKSYGFNSKYKLKHAILSPSKGDTLYPTFDDTGDMIAFSREFSKKDGDKTIKIFETWTKDEHIIYQNSENGWTEIFTTIAEDGTGIREKLTIGKIPVIYSYRNQPIWRDADSGKVHEIELLLSRNGDTIAYHSAPVLLVKGKLVGAPTKGESNKVFFSDDGSADAKYVSWQQAPEAVKFQFETLLRLFFQELQLPDLSFENIKGIGAQSGVSMQMLFSDAHLKVGDESEIYEELFEREYSIIKAFLAKMNTKWESTIEDIEIEPVITPFMINDEKTQIEMLVAASGNKPVISQKTAIKMTGLIDNADDEYEQIKSENVVDLGDSAI